MYLDWIFKLEFLIRFCQHILSIHKDSLWHLQMCLQSTLIKFTPSIILPYPLPPLRIILTGFILPFSYRYAKYVDHIHLLHPLFNPPSSGAHLRWDLFDLPVLQFLNVYLLFKGVSPWYFSQECIIL
jgi:hypothetical protein